MTTSCAPSHENNGHNKYRDNKSDRYSQYPVGFHDRLQYLSAPDVRDVSNFNLFFNETRFGGSA